MMKRLLLSLATTGMLLTASFGLTPQASAQFDPFNEVCNNTDQETTTCQVDGSTNPVSGSDGIILRAVRILSIIIGIASVIMIIIGGIKYITSNGDSNSISSAKNTILYALLGVVVFLISQGIVLFVLSNL